MRLPSSLSPTSSPPPLFTSVSSATAPPRHVAPCVDLHACPRARSPRKPERGARRLFSNREARSGAAGGLRRASRACGFAVRGGSKVLDPELPRAPLRKRAGVVCPSPAAVPLSWPGVLVHPDGVAGRGPRAICAADGGRGVMVHVRILVASPPTALGGPMYASGSEHAPP